MENPNSEEEFYVVIVGDERNTESSSKTTAEVINDNLNKPMNRSTYVEFQRLANLLHDDISDSDDHNYTLSDTINFSSDDKEQVIHIHPLSNSKNSYIVELLRKYPGLSKDVKILMRFLAHKMKNTIPPPLAKNDFNIINGKYVCAVCDNTYILKLELKRHFQENHGLKYLDCYACGENFRSLTGICEHEKCCTGPHINIVREARAYFNSQILPYINYDEDDANEESTCNGTDVDQSVDQCELSNVDNSIENSEILDTDLMNGLNVAEITLSSENELFSCSKCSMTFWTEDYFIQHEAQHSFHRPFACDKCPRTYMTKQALKKHFKEHGDRPYQCDHCGLAFTKKNSLVLHLYTHDTVKRFGCEECEKRYATKAALKLHVHLRHRNLPPPCACDICPKRFPRMWLLKKHMKNDHGVILMTKMMYLKSLPNLSKLQMDKAKIIWKNETRHIQVNGVK